MRSIKNVKLLLVSVSLERKGGVAQYVINLLEHFKGKDIDAKHFTQQGLLFNILAFIISLKRGKYDVVHFNPSLGHRALLRDFTYSIFADFMGYKTLFFIHGWDEGTYRTIKRSSLYSQLFKYLINRQDSIVVLDGEYKDKLIGLGCHADLIYVSSTMVDTKKYCLEIDSKDDETINLVFCSRVEREKGIFLLIDALEHLPADIYKRVKLTFVGIGSGLDELKKVVSDKNLEDKVELKGFVSEDEKIRTYLKGDIFMFPSFHGEGFPTVILEAMAAGLPVITTDIGGTKRAIEEGVNGFYLDNIPPKPEDIAKKIIKVLNSDMDQISRNNLLKVRELFDSEVVIGKLTDIYEKIKPPFKILLVGPCVLTGGVGGMLTSEYELLEKIDKNCVDIFDIQSLKKNILNVTSLLNKLICADITHIHCSFATILSSFQLTIPLFLAKVTCTESVITYHRGEPAPYFNEATSFSQLLFSFPDVITVPSNKQKDIFLRYDIANKDKVTVLYNFIKTYYIRKSRAASKSEKRNTVITTGEVSKDNISRKGFDDFIELAKQMTDINFYLIGKLEDKEAFKLKENSPPNLHMKGFISEEELADYYAASKVYLQLSRSESFGVSMVEAMCFNCIPIIYDRGALPEVIGGEGYIVEYKDIDGVKENILRVIGGEHNKRPRQIVMDRYTPNVYLKRFKTIINEMT